MYTFLTALLPVPGERERTLVFSFNGVKLPPSVSPRVRSFVKCIVGFVKCSVVNVVNVFFHV